MTARILDGRAIADSLLDSLRIKVEARLAEGKPAPGLAVVLVGSDPASQSYVRNKRRAAEKVGIRVEDAPFIAVDAEIGPDAVTFETMLGDRATAGPDHPVTIRGTAEEPRPYVEIRRGLLARIDRKTFYRLAAAANEGPDGRIGLHSAGQFFALES